MNDSKRHRYGQAGPRQGNQGSGTRKGFMSLNDGNSSMQFGFAQNAKGHQAFAMKSTGKGHSFALGFANMGKENKFAMQINSQGGKRQMLFAMQSGGKGGSQFGFSMSFGNHGKTAAKGNKEFSPMGKNGGPGLAMTFKMGGLGSMKMHFGNEGNQMSMKFGGGKGKQGAMSMSFGLSGAKGGMGLTMGLGGKTGPTGFGGGGNGKPVPKALTGPGHK